MRHSKKKKQLLDTFRCSITSVHEACQCHSLKNDLGVLLLLILLFSPLSDDFRYCNIVSSRLYLKLVITDFEVWISMDSYSSTPVVRQVLLKSICIIPLAAILPKLSIFEYFKTGQYTMAPLTSCVIVRPRWHLTKW